MSSDPLLLQLQKVWKEIADKLDTLVQIHERAPTVIAVTGDELIRCLERLGKSTKYYVPTGKKLAPGESVTFTIAPPPTEYCIVARALMASSLSFTVSASAEFLVKEKMGEVRKARISFPMWFPEWSSRLIDFIFCEPRIESSFTFTNNEPAGGPDAYAGVWQECNVVLRDTYNIVEKAILNRVWRLLSFHGLEVVKVAVAMRVVKI